MSLNERLFRNLEVGIAQIESPTVEDALELTSELLHDFLADQTLTDNEWMQAFTLSNTVRGWLEQRQQDRREARPVVNGPA
jgi:hypothetical protein